MSMSSAAPSTRAAGLVLSAPSTKKSGRDTMLARLGDMGPGAALGAAPIQRGPRRCVSQG